MILRGNSMGLGRALGVDMALRKMQLDTIAFSPSTACHPCNRNDGAVLQWLEASCFETMWLDSRAKDVREPRQESRYLGIS